MAIRNSTLDGSEQKKVFSVSRNTNVNGQTVAICIVPWPSALVGAQQAAFGVSGSPTTELSVTRFIVGTGVTTWILATGTSNVARAYGTSGVGGGLSSMLVQGSSLLNLLPNDLVVATLAGGTGAASDAITIGVVLQPIQDIKYNYNQSF